MRKLFFLFCCILIFNSLSAQLTKGTWLVGGNGSYLRSTPKGQNTGSNKSRLLVLSPNIGYFVADKLSVGALITTIFGKNVYREPNGSDRELIQNSVGLGPSMRYYYLKHESIVNIISEANIIYYSLQNNNSGNLENSGNTLEYNFLAGPVIFFNSSVGLEFLLGYKHIKELQTDARTNSFNIKIGIQFHLEKN